MSGSAFSAELEQAVAFERNGCRVVWHGRTLLVSNDCFEGTLDFGAVFPVAAFVVDADAARFSPVSSEGVCVSALIGGSKTLVGLYAGIPGVIVQSDTDLPFPLLSGRHVRFTEYQLVDQTDVNNELVHRREWLIFGNERPWRVAAQVLDFEDVVGGDGQLFVRLGPTTQSLPPGTSADFTVSGQGSREIVVHPTGYPVAVLRYRGGREGRIAALQRFQRALRPYRTGRDGFFLTNTWGDGHRDTRVCESFLLGEVEAGVALGVDVIQIDAGWQTGNGPARGGVEWKRYWNVPTDFWTVNTNRFPSGLASTVRAARAKGLEFGLWYAPDSSDAHSHAKRDAATLVGFWRTLGIRYFKTDFLSTPSVAALTAQHDFYNEMLAASGGEMVFDLDVTGQVPRPGYFGLPQVGTVFVENRYMRSAYDRLWYPHQTLRNLWKLAELVDPVRLRMEILNPLRNPQFYRPDDPLQPSRWPADALFALVMTASPLGWFEIQNLAPETVSQLKPLVATWKRERSRYHGGTIVPVGSCPDGVSWTGFVSVGAGGAGYALLFRELAEDAVFSLALPDALARATSAQVIGGRGTAAIADGRLTVNVPNTLDFVWVKLPCPATRGKNNQGNCQQGTCSGKERKGAR